LISHHLHSNFTRIDEKNVKRICILRDPNERIISRYFYFKNAHKAKKINPSNIVLNQNLSFESFLDHLKLSYNDNFLLRMITGKINKKIYKTLKYKNIKYKKLTDADLKKAIDILQEKYDIIYFDKKLKSFNNYLIKNFYINPYSLKLNNHFKNSSYKTRIKITKKIENKLRKINNYDKKIFEYFKQIK